MLENELKAVTIRLPINDWKNYKALCKKEWRSASKEIHGFIKNQLKGGTTNEQ